MALLDVSDIVTDPDFMDTGLVCERNAQTVNESGLATNTTTKTRFSAVVTSNNGDILERMAAGERIKGSITLHTRFALREGRAGFTADVVEWRGRRYTVSEVMDYSNFGRGFFSANCDLIPLAG